MQNECAIQKMQAKVEKKKQNNTQKPKTHPSPIPTRDALS